MNHLNRPDPIARARQLRPAIEAHADELERTKRIPTPLLDELHRARVFRMLMPRSVGGDEIEPWTYLSAVEEVGRADASVAWNMFVANSSALIAPFLALLWAILIGATAAAIWRPRMLGAPWRLAVALLAASAR